ncbi:type IV pilin protein [Gilvimarinus polysaccharolyticus]|uniref:type IV pilin protein n=1 Tax=Gilvimarinus polysaccharolyticus TaxID=863921 RepID=UPI00067319F3|nr:type IV pilin protein [Gilvimarinus polysaccharolyticus]
MKKEKGFTLIEVMIVVAIIGIIAVIAVPSYLDNIRRANRADATTSLTNVAHQMQRCYTLNNSYTGCPSIGTRTSDEDFYTIVVALTDAGAGYTATATPAKTPQTGDSDCASLTLNNLGQKSASPDSEGRCW